MSDAHRGPWLTSREAAEHLRYKGRHALRSLYRFLKRKRIEVRYRSPRSILVAKADLDRALKVAPTALRQVS